MKFFKKYIFPALYGLLIYATLRLLTDSVSGAKFWKRPLLLNLSEVTLSIVMGYFVIAKFRALFRWFDRKWEKSLSYKRIIKEIGYLVLTNLIIQNAILVPFTALTDDGMQIYDFIDVNVIPLLFALIYYGIARSNTFMRQYVDSKLQIEKITNDQLQTELKFLRAQYHPHFLFNALNAIYFQMDENVPEAKRTVEKFSELLRYQLYDQQQTVPITREIQYLENFIAIQKIRTSSKLQLDFSFDKRLSDEQIYPLLFLPLVENAFKYVGGSYIIKINLEKSNGTLQFGVENSVREDPVNGKTGGIGLENLKRRLELLYPGRHSLTIQPGADKFSASLSLQLN